MSRRERRNFTQPPKVVYAKNEGFEIDLDSREVVTVVVSSLTGYLGKWAVDHADEISKLDIIYALTAYVSASFSNEALEGMNL